MIFTTKKAMLGVAVIGLTGLASTATADVRVIHASPDAPNVDVYVNGTPGIDAPAFSDLAFTAGTDYVGLPTGDYNFQVTPTGLESPIVINADASIDADTDYTIAAGGFLDSIAPFIYVDDNTIDDDKARVRFIHLSPDAPTVDIFAAGLTDPIFDAVSFGESGGYISVDEGSYDLDVRLDADGTSVLPLNDILLEAGTVYTVFAMGSVADNTLQAVIFVDAVPAPGAFALLAGAAFAGRRRRRA